jgi:hypothetical protein
MAAAGTSRQPNLSSVAHSLELPRLRLFSRRVRLMEGLQPSPLQEDFHCQSLWENEESAPQLARKKKRISDSLFRQDSSVTTPKEYENMRIEGMIR